MTCISEGKVRPERRWQPTAELVKKNPPPSPPFVRRPDFCTSAAETAIFFPHTQAHPPGPEITAHSSFKRARVNKFFSQFSKDTIRSLFFFLFLQKTKRDSNLEPSHESNLTTGRGSTPTGTRATERSPARTPPRCDPSTTH